MIIFSERILFLYEIIRFRINISNMFNIAIVVAIFLIPLINSLRDVTFVLCRDGAYTVTMYLITRNQSPYT